MKSRNKIIASTVDLTASCNTFFFKSMLGSPELLLYVTNGSMRNLKLIPWQSSASKTREVFKETEDFIKNTGLKNLLENLSAKACWKWSLGEEKVQLFALFGEAFG